MKDIVGATITVGQTIAYPGRKSSSLWMNVAIVDEIDETEGRLKVRIVNRQYILRGTSGQPHWINRIDRVAVTLALAHG